MFRLIALSIYLIASVSLYFHKPSEDILIQREATRHNASNLIVSEGDGLLPEIAPIQTAQNASDHVGKAPFAPPAANTTTFTRDTGMTSINTETRVSYQMAA